MEESQMAIPTPQTIFTRDILGNYVCNTFAEAIQSGPFDVIIVGGGHNGLVAACYLARAGLEEAVATGIVLTGGSAKMEGAIELAEEVFHMPVRLGVPQYVSGLVDVVSNPIHATGVGLLLYAKSNMDVRRAEGPLLAGGVKSILDRMKAWFQGNF